MEEVFTNDEYQSGDIVNNAVFKLEEIPPFYEQFIELDLPNFNILQNNFFEQRGKKGCANEFVYYYLTQLTGNPQPLEDGSGKIPFPKDLYKLYDESTVTNYPNVGYGYSVVAPFGGTNLYGYGSCGVVLSILRDGSFLCASYDTKPYHAPSRQVCIFNISGTDIESIDKFKFFKPI